MPQLHSIPTAPGQGDSFDEAGRHKHVVQFYDRDESLSGRVVSFLRDGVREREPAVLIATGDHCNLFTRQLSASGIDFDAVCGAGGLTILEARETLAKFMVDDMPDWRRFRTVVGGAIERALAASSAPRVRAYGEMVDVLWREGNPKAALRLEELWNDLSGIHPFSLLCAYRMGNFYKEADGTNFEHICRAHTHVVPTESYPQSGDEDLRRREVSLLQQRAKALETEISHRKELEEALRAARAEAEAASRAKDEFLAMLGHELRNPLSPIVTALQLMRLRGDNSAPKERAIIERQVKHLVRLVDDLLDVSRVTRGKLELHREPVELAEVIAKAVEMQGPLLEGRAHQLTLDVPRSRRLRVQADSARLAQVFSNLLANAAKYTDPGGRIVVAAERVGDTIAVRVTDNGAGIDPRLMPRIFDLFIQAKQTLDRSQGGLGIGLTIVRNLVELHGGTVSAHSDGLGRGSEFVVELPALDRKTSSGAAVPRVPAGPKATSKRLWRSLRVLVVDDNEDAAMLVTETLQDMGYEARQASDGLSALLAAAQFHPHAAVLDIGLPGMDGYELARRLAAAHAGIRLIALTGYGQLSDRRLSAEAGFVEHMVKPLSLERLSALLDGMDKSVAASTR